MRSRPLGADEFTTAFAQNGRALWVLACAWVGRDQAEDLVQETARVAWQRREQFVTGTELRPWLSTIARQIASNWRRKMAPISSDPASLPESVAPTPIVGTWPFDADRAGLSDEMLAGLSQLNETSRACLLLHVVLGMSFGEVAVMLDINENTASSHARRARAALREHLAGPDAKADSTPVIRER